ncbi:hypothetical protein [Bacillus sp. AFS014408]|uniref:hypothetical protein n=1 Tax=Bacillus sp. AFS014408 TaxID=2034278 RepID=UPI0011452876|nr:hypothetical protein [Bacillus sp. AFS014408]
MRVETQVKRLIRDTCACYTPKEGNCIMIGYIVMYCVNNNNRGDESFHDWKDLSPLFLWIIPSEYVIYCDIYLPKVTCYGLYK